jgi:hypothetical protein
VAVLCVERDETLCHRRLVLDACRARHSTRARGPRGGGIPACAGSAPGHGARSFCCWCWSGWR